MLLWGCLSLMTAFIEVCSWQHYGFNNEARTAAQRNLHRQTNLLPQLKTRPRPSLQKVGNHLHKYQQQVNAGRASQSRNIGRKFTRKQQNLRRRLGNPIEWAGLFEGDIAGVDRSAINSGGIRNAVRREHLLWPGGIVPYTTSTSVTFSSDELRAIEEGIKNFRDVTCIRFVPRSNQKDYVVINKGIGCSSVVGRQGGAQQLSLGSGCYEKETVIHELMHAVGFWHEHTRPDRDNYVTIRFENITPKEEHNFIKNDLSEVQTLNTQYDIQSVMHYGPTYFSKDKISPTIVSKSGISIPRERTGFSNNDILRINRLYRCQTFPRVNGICEDRHGLCSRWAANHQCSVNPRYMLPQCPKSCNQCSHPDISPVPTGLIDLWHL